MLGGGVPSILRSDQEKWILGAEAEAIDESAFSIEGFERGLFQEEAEKVITRNIPARVWAVMSNAALQRSFIVMSNAAFGFEAFPTYFGSAYEFIPAESAIAQIPRNSTSSMEAKWDEFGMGVKRTAEAFPEKRFVIYVVGGYQETACNPATPLISGPSALDVCLAHMNTVAAECPNVVILTSPYATTEEYYEDFYRTDHHWNIRGAFRAYGQICEELSLDEIAMGGEWEIPDYSFTGTTARGGKDLLGEDVSDCVVDFSQLNAVFADGSIVNGSDHSDFWDYPEAGKPFVFYAQYYDDLNGESGACCFEGGTGSRNGLLIGNSYKGAIQRPLAVSYERLAVNNQLHPSSAVESTLRDQIVAAEADDVIFMANPSNLCVDPAYFE